MKRTAAYLGILAAVLFALSFWSAGWQAHLDLSVKRTAMHVRDRQKSVYRYVEKELQAPQESCIGSNLPDNIVIYKYRRDSLTSWANQFPVADDEIRAYTFAYRLHPYNSGPFGQPLAYLDKGEWQYMNLGDRWYLVLLEESQDGQTSIVAGTEMDFRIPAGFTHAPVYEYPAGAVSGMDGTPLFSIVPAKNSRSSTGSSALKWIALLIAVAAFVHYHYTTRSALSFIITAAGFEAVRLLTIAISPGPTFDSSIFSPIIYAGDSYAPSLGDFLLNNALVFGLIWLIYSMRRKVSVMFAKGVHRRMCAAAAWILATALAFYIHFSLQSLALNSSIVLDPAWIQKFSWNSVLCYFSLATLVLAFLLMLQTAIRFTAGGRRRFPLFSWKGIAICSAAISIYFVAAESGFGLKKEYDANRISTTKLALRRDIRFELYLKMMERDVAGDAFIAALTSIDGGEEMLKKRLAERYFYKDLAGRYDISISLCGQADMISDGSSEPQPCFQYFQELAGIHGDPVDGSSNFTFIESVSGASYLGTFPFYNEKERDVKMMYIEFKEKRHTKPQFISPEYSYAVYSSGRLADFGGEFGYSTTMPQGYRTGYSMVTKERYIHFVNNINGNLATIISRPHKPAMPYAVAFSYLFIFFGLFIMVCTTGHGRGYLLSMPKHSLKRKITLISSGTMMVALASMGMASVAYNVRQSRHNERIQIENRISTVQNALLRSGNDISAGLSEAAAIVNSDINVYDRHGKLFASSNRGGKRPGDAGWRINSRAYHEIVHLNAVRSVQTEVNGGKESKSLFAPLTGADGEFVGIVNIPFANYGEMSEDSYATVVMIINLYIVLLLAALVLGILLSNSMLKPIRAIREKMESLTISPGRNKHIHYSSMDEIGVLVNAYNEMVDALEESSRKLAQNEREIAWKEMARQIAHDIKNPLTPMRLSIQYLMRLKQQNVPGWEEKVCTIGKSIIEQIDILSDESSQFSAIASGNVEEFKEVDLDNLLTEEIGIFTTRDNIALVYDCRVDKPVIRTQRKQMGRVITNLLTNAVQAIESGRGSGNIRITLSALSEDGEEYYKLVFEDDGPGVKAENTGKLFTPNFTTKSSGTGLGLAICKSIVEQSGASISYSPSKSLGGAAFTILFKK